MPSASSWNVRRELRNGGKKWVAPAPRAPARNLCIQIAKGTRTIRRGTNRTRSRGRRVRRTRTAATNPAPKAKARPCARNSAWSVPNRRAQRHERAGGRAARWPRARRKRHAVRRRGSPGPAIGCTPAGSEEGLPSGTPGPGHRERDTGKRTPYKNSSRRPLPSRPSPGKSLGGESTRRTGAGAGRTGGRTAVAYAGSPSWAAASRSCMCAPKSWNGGYSISRSGSAFSTATTRTTARSGQPLQLPKIRRSRERSAGIMRRPFIHRAWRRRRRSPPAHSRRGATPREAHRLAAEQTWSRRRAKLASRRPRHKDRR